MNVHVPIFTYSPNALMQIRYLEGGFFFHIQNAIEVFFPILHVKVTLIFMRYDQIIGNGMEFYHFAYRVLSFCCNVPIKTEKSNFLWVQKKTFSEVDFFLSFEP